VSGDGAKSYKSEDDLRWGLHDRQQKHHDVGLQGRQLTSSIARQYQVIGTGRAAVEKSVGCRFANNRETAHGLAGVASDSMMTA
jgi:hypothetical protein